MPTALVEVLVLVQHAQRLDSEIIYDRDFDYDYFGFKVGLLTATCCYFLCVLVNLSSPNYAVLCIALHLVYPLVCKPVHRTSQRCTADFDNRLSADTAYVVIPVLNPGIPSCFCMCCETTSSCFREISSCTAMSRIR